MKTLGFLILFITNVFCQDTAIDSSAVKFKASLFTVSEFGIASKEIILKDLENQKTNFLETKYKKFSFLKVEFSQPYRMSDSNYVTLIRDCTYYLAFNLEDKKFYKLGGFNTLDIDDFIKDLERLEIDNNIPWDEKNIIKEIDINCLYEYSLLDKKKRLKSNFKCFENCSENTKTYYIEH